ncbi:MAG TPA: DegT/DnrJ/EryC1/StrS family aminotransferase, partial [Candidatus Binatia bacterium]|nr:DegT/DnrJ/EryC1/StrS family aminotransferase [Candidatus Binatia bacterium]
KNAGPDSPPSPYRKETLPNLNAAVALSLVQTLNENIAARRMRVRAYQELLGSEEDLTLISHRPGSACLTQVVRILPGSDGDDLSARVIGTLRQAGYEVQGSYVPIHLLPYYDLSVRNNLSHAEWVWSDLIELPCEPEVSLRHVEQIAAIIREVLRKPSTSLKLPGRYRVAIARPFSSCGHGAFRCISQKNSLNSIYRGAHEGL